MANTLNSLTVEIGTVLSALEEAVARSTSTKAYINFLGWELPPGLDDIGLAGLDFAALLEKLRIVTESSETDWEDEILMAPRITELAIAAGKLVQAIRQLAETLPTQLSAHGDYVARTNIHKELPRRMFDLLIASYMADRSPLIFAVANLLNVVEFKHFDADEETFQVKHVRAIIHYDHIHSLLSDPSAHMRESYGWGTTNFVVLDLLTRIAQVLRTMGASIRLQPMDLRVEHALLARTVPSTAEPSPQLNLYLYEQLGVLAGQRLGVSVFGVRPSTADAADGGIGFLPIMHGQAKGAIPLHAFTDTFLEYSAEAELLQRIALILRPNHPLQVQRASSLTDLTEGRVALGIRHGEVDSAPKVLVTLPGGGVFSIRQFSLTGGLDRVSGATAESFLELGLSGCQMTFSLSESDGFLSSAVSQDQIEALVDLRLGWTSSKGIYFHGGGGLHVTLPLHLVQGPFQLDSLHLAFDIKEEGFDVEASTSGSLSIGPVTVTVDRLGLLVNVSFKDGNLGFFGLSPRFKPPTGLGVVIDTPLVVGGGYLFFDPEQAEYGGILQLEVAETIAVKAIGLLTTRLPGGAKGYSLLILISAEGFAPIQLGLGFTLTGIGGLLGVNRTARVDMLRNGLKQGTLGSILFPQDPIRNAPQIVSDLRAVFPPAPGRFLFGPMAIIGWGTPTILTLELALILELPAPVRLIILGRLLALLPDEAHALVRVRMDAIGVIDFNRGEISLDAVLYDSRILAFTLTGEMALRASWGAQPRFVLAIGGFHPRFAAPADFPKLKRLALNISDSDSLRLRCDAYLALTSNTVQFGARVELHAAGGGFSFDGYLGFDALFQFSPFAFVVDLAAGIALRYHGRLLMGIHFEGRLSGPTPWQIQGKATIKIWFFKVTVDFKRQFGPDVPPPVPAPLDVQALVLAAVQDARNWSGTLLRGEHPLVTLRDRAGSGTPLFVHPLAEVTVRQRIVPLNRTIDKVGSAPVRGERQFTLHAIRADQATGALPLATTPVHEAFALAQYQEMSDGAKLSRPSFESQEAGLRLGTEMVAYAYDPVVDDAITYETELVVPGQGPEPTAPSRPRYTMTAAVLDAVVGTGAAGQAAIRRRGRTRHTAGELVA